MHCRQPRRIAFGFIGEAGRVDSLKIHESESPVLSFANGNKIMKRFGTIFPFLEQGSAPLRMGRLVANHDFTKALLKYSSFDQFYFSNPSLNNLKSFQRTVEK